MNPHPGNTRETYIDLPNEMSLESLHILEKFEIIEPLEYNIEQDYMKPFKSRLPFFILNGIFLRLTGLMISIYLQLKVIHLFIPPL